VNVLKKTAAIVEEADDEEGGGDSGEDGRDPGQHLFLPSEDDEPKLGVETARSVYRFRSDDGQAGSNHYLLLPTIQEQGQHRLHTLNKVAST
jgi:hypothetical protein